VRLTREIEKELEEWAELGRKPGRARRSEEVASNSWITLSRNMDLTLSMRQRADYMTDVRGPCLDPLQTAVGFEEVAVGT
jgi:hypothetical protein